MILATTEAVVGKRIVTVLGLVAPAGTSSVPCSAPVLVSSFTVDSCAYIVAAEPIAAAANSMERIMSPSRLRE